MQEEKTWLTARNVGIVSKLDATVHKVFKVNVADGLHVFLKQIFVKQSFEMDGAPGCHVTTIFISRQNILAGLWSSSVASGAVRSKALVLLIHYLMWLPLL